MFAGSEEDHEYSLIYIEQHGHQLHLGRHQATIYLTYDRWPCQFWKLYEVETRHGDAQLGYHIQFHSIEDISG